jgi:hypothetical protein
VQPVGWSDSGTVCARLLPVGEARGARGAEDVLRTQRAFYDLLAPDYADMTKPSDRAERGLMDAAMARRLIDELGPTGDVLELACGAGAFTRELAGRCELADGGRRFGVHARTQQEDRCRPEGGLHLCRLVRLDAARRLRPRVLRILVAGK